MNSLPGRVYGVFRRPRATFAAVIAAPAWAPVLIGTTLITFACSAGFLRTQVGQQALVDQWERTALAFGFVAFLYVILNRTTRRRASYAQVLAVVCYAGVILALRQVIATPVDYLRESIASPTTLVQFFTMLDEASPVARFLGVIDLFVVWWIVVLAIGISVLYERPTRRLALVFASAYVALAFLAALAMAMSGGTA